jgi:HAD superfamily hydrolase (TIGR01509 family)
MVDSESIARDAWRVLLERHGLEMDEQTAGAILGLRLEDSSDLVRQRFDLPLAVEEIMEQRRSIFDVLAAGRLEPMPGLAELLVAIDRLGLKRAVATSSRLDYATRTLSMIGAADGFGAIVTGEMVQNGKPAPDIYLAAAEALAIPAGACLALEDAPHGVQAAKAAGMICVAVPNRFTAQLDLGMADRILPSLATVKDELEALIQM